MRVSHEHGRTARRTLVRYRHDNTRERLDVERRGAGESAPL